MTKTCKYCKLEIPTTALVCGHCRKNQPRSSVPKTPEEIKAGRNAMLGCVGLLGAVLVIVMIIGIVSSIRESLEKSRINAEIARREKMELQTSRNAAKAILPGIYRYADIMEGKIKISGAQQGKEAASLRNLGGLIKEQNGKVEALNLGSPANDKSWNKIEQLLISDAGNFEACTGPAFDCRDGRAPHFSKMKKDERATAASIHRKLASVLEKHVSEGHWALSEPDLYRVGGVFAYDPDEHVRVAVPGRLGTSDHVSFINETSDLPPDAQRALDEIYKSDSERARELNRLAHEGGLQNLPAH